MASAHLPLLAWVINSWWLGFLLLSGSIIFQVNLVRVDPIKWISSVDFDNIPGNGKWKWQVEAQPRTIK